MKVRQQQYHVPGYQVCGMSMKYSWRVQGTVRGLAYQVRVYYNTGTCVLTPLQRALERTKHRPKLCQKVRLYGNLNELERTEWKITRQMLVQIGCRHRTDSMQREKNSFLRRGRTCV